MDLKILKDYFEKLGNFLRVAFEFLGHLVNRASLQRTDKVLDVGCGTGRIAYALTYYLSPVAGYEGFDIVERLIQWAQQTITPRFPNFNFRKVVGAYVLASYSMSSQNA